MQPADRLAEDAPGEPADFAHLLRSGHEVQLEYPPVAGRFFMRTIRGHLVCHDLRKR